MSILIDRVKETTTTTGSGSITTSGVAPAGYQTFVDANLDGFTVDYCIEAVDGSGVPTGEWEVGRGVYTAAGSTLTRDNVLASSNSAALVNFSAGTKNVFVTAAADTIGNKTVANTWSAIQTFGAGVQSSAGVAWSATATAPAQISTAQAGVAASITASAAVAGSSVAGAAAGGSVTITAGAAARLTSGNANGGDIVLTGGAGIGTGTVGIADLTGVSRLGAPGGSGSVPGLSLGGDTTTGMQRTASNIWSFLAAGTAVVRLQATGIRVTSTIGFLWSSGGFGSADDTGLHRNAAGVVEVNNGTAGTLRDLTFRQALSNVGNAPTTPAYSFSGDANTGMYSSSADVCCFATNGTLRGQFTNNGFTVVGVLYGNTNTTIEGFRRKVTTFTTDGVVDNSDALRFTVMGNEGATALVTRTLPSAVQGAQYTFVCMDADGFKIVAATGDEIRVIDKVTATAGYIQSTTIGSTVTLLAMNATTWVATAIQGVWTDGTFTYDDTALTTP